MVKKKILVILTFGLFIGCSNGFAQSDANEELMECLSSENHQQIKRCMKEKFPRFMKVRFEPSNLDMVMYCSNSDPEYQEVCREIKKMNIRIRNLKIY